MQTLVDGGIQLGCDFDAQEDKRLEVARSIHYPNRFLQVANALPRQWVERGFLRLYFESWSLYSFREWSHDCQGDQSCMIRVLVSLTCDKAGFENR